MCVAEAQACGLVLASLSGAVRVVEKVHPGDRLAALGRWVARGGSNDSHCGARRSVCGACTTVVQRVCESPRWSANCLCSMRLESFEQIQARGPMSDSTKPAVRRAGGGVGRAPVPLMDPEAAPVLQYRDPPVTEGSLFLALGCALAVVGVFDLALLWVPMELGTAGWEFAAVSRTFTNAPMTMVGLVLIAFGLVRRGTRPTMIRRASVAFAALSFVLVAMGLLYALAAPAVLSQASGEGATALKRAMLKNGVEIVVYPAVLMLIAAILWQAVWEDKSD